MTDELYFYRSTGRYGFMSNLYPCTVVFEGIEFPSSEHAYQYGKAKDEVIKNTIRDMPKPVLACILGHGLFPYMVVPNWKEIRIIRMGYVVRAKFEQHPELQEKLLETHPMTLIENSKSDNLWGIGRTGKGQNLLGGLLMVVRDEIKIRKESE